MVEIWKWQWQEPGTAWRGVGVYHVTLTVPSREPLFGRLVMQDDALFDACAAGRLLILSPWPYDEGKRHISRAECVALNAMAEEICGNLNDSESNLS